MSNDPVKEAAVAMLAALEVVLRSAHDNGKTFKLLVASDSGCATKIRESVEKAKAAGL